MTKDKKKRQCTFFLEGDLVQYKQEVVDALPQEVYDVLKCDSDRQLQKKRRSGRCQIKGANGKVKRCTENCDKCPYIKGYSYNPNEPRPGERTGGVISIELLEEIGKPVSITMSIETSLEQEELHRALHTAIRTLDDIDQHITTLLLDDLSERAIAQAIGAKQTLVHYHKIQIIIPALQEKLKDFR